MIISGLAMLLALSNPYYLATEHSPLSVFVDVSDSTGITETTLREIQKDLRLQASAGDQVFLFANRMRRFPSGSTQDFARLLTRKEVSSGSDRQIGKRNPIAMGSLDRTKTRLDSVNRYIAGGDIPRGSDLLIISDGQFSPVSMTRLINISRQKQVAVHTVSRKESPGDLWISDIQYPVQTLPRSDFEVSVEVGARNISSGSLIIKRSSKTLHQTSFQISSGKRTFRVRVPGPDEQEEAYSVHVRTSSEEWTLNNNIVRWVVAPTNHRQVLVVGSRKQFERVKKLLHSGKQDLSRDGSEASPLDLQRKQTSSPRPLARYDLIIFAGHREDVAQKWMKQVERMLRRGLIGVAMVGTSQTFLPGNWNNTPVEKLLPVDMTPPGHRDVVFVVDVSGSMNQSNSPGAPSSLQIFRQNISRYLQWFHKTDRAGIVAFSKEAQTVLPFRSLEDKSVFHERFLRLQSGGGTRVSPAIRRAKEMLGNREASREQYLFLMSDTQFSENKSKFRQMGQKLNKLGISIFVLSTHRQNEEMLEFLTHHESNGRVFYVGDHKDLNETFRNMIFRVLKPVSDQKVQVVSDPHEYLPDTMEKHPETVGKRHRVTMKRRATAGLYTGGSLQSEPLVSGWTYGQGRSIAFTPIISAFTNRSEVAFQRWNQILRYGMTWTLPAVQNQDWNISVSMKQGQPVVDVVNNQSERTDLLLRGSGALWKEGRKVVERQGTTTGKGSISFSFPEVEKGVYRFRANIQDVRNERSHHVQSPATVPFHQEYISPASEPKKLQRISEYTDGLHDQQIASLMNRLDTRNHRLQKQRMYVRKYLLMVALIAILLFAGIRVRRQYNLP